LDGSRGGGVQSSEAVETVFIAEHGGQRSQASMLTTFPGNCFRLAIGFTWV
jgi:hypothetical protein